MNKACVAFNENQYKQVIGVLRNGFTDADGVIHRPNRQIATVGVLETTLGLRIGDILDLRLSSFVKDNDRYRLDIKEEKTGKSRTFTVPTEVYVFIQNYAIENNIGRDVKLFKISYRQVNRYLNMVFRYLNLDGDKYGTHSFRKLFATKAYEDSDYDIELVRMLLQHTNSDITRRYIKVDNRRVEAVLSNATENLI